MHENPEFIAPHGPIARILMHLERADGPAARVRRMTHPRHAHSGARRGASCTLARAAEEARGRAIHSPRRGRTPQPSSSEIPNSTGTEPTVVRNTVSRATTSAVSYFCAKLNTFCAVGSAASTVTA